MATLKLFLSYAHEDKELKESFFPFLRALEKKRNLSIWVDNEIKAGDNWEPAIMSNLEASQIILLFLSIDFLNSDFCTTRELRTALELHKARRALVIPIVVRAIPDDSYEFNGIQALPNEKRAVASWPSLDEAWKHVYHGIDEAIEKALGGLLDTERCNITYRIQKVTGILEQGEIGKALDMLIDFCQDFSPGNPMNRFKAVACKATFGSLGNADVKQRFEIIIAIQQLMYDVSKEPLLPSANPSANS